MTKHTTREAWLLEAVEQFRPWFSQEGADLPVVQVSIGVQSRSNTLATCWQPAVKPGEVEDEKVAHIFVTPAIQPENPNRLLDILLHELVHAAGHVAGFEGHGKEFGALARALGLCGKMTATVASEELNERLDPIAEHLGDFPHRTLDMGGLGPNGKKKQTTRQKKSQCPGCEYTARVSQKWLDIAAPLCPNPACGNYGHEMEQV